MLEYGDNEHIPSADARARAVQCADRAYDTLLRAEQAQPHEGTLLLKASTYAQISLAYNQLV